MVDSDSDEYTFPFAGGVAAAVDWGGEGPDLLLTHGLGSNLASMRILRRQLDSFRLVAVDLPGHGRSAADRPFSLDLGARALEAVAAGLALDRPGVVGHSLGGMVGVAYAAAHPECPGVVNLDGHGSGTPDLYVGFEAENVRRFQHALAASSVVTAPAEGDAAWVDAQVEAFASRFGATADTIRPFIEREYVETSPGRFLHRPTPNVRVEMQADLDERPMLGRYDDVRCPVLVYSTTRIDPVPDVPESEAMMGAYRAGLEEAFRTLAASHLPIEFEVVDTGHNLIYEIPAEIADRVRRFFGVCTETVEPGGPPAG